MKCIKTKITPWTAYSSTRPVLPARFLHRELRQLPELQRPGFREGRSLCREPHRPWNPLYRIHELQGKTGPKRGCNRRRYLRRPCLLVTRTHLYKVIKVSDATELGRHIVVQGGTFYNDAVLRSFEKIADCEAIRPDIAGIMGAFGAALIARERYVEGAETTMLSIEKINELQFTTRWQNVKAALTTAV